MGCPEYLRFIPGLCYVSERGYEYYVYQIEKQYHLPLFVLKTRVATGIDNVFWDSITGKRLVTNKAATYFSGMKIVDKDFDCLKEISKNQVDIFAD